tara:strand:+ start:769 stop:909 length:141 start_codon:yes stop_codon:yes gene_type:complete
MWEIVFENRIRFGINIGFEFYSPDEESDTYEFHLNLLIIKIGMIWH